MSSPVVYFSETGNAKRVAESLAASLGSPYFELKPTTPYTGADLDWRSSTSRSTLEGKDPSMRPTYDGEGPDLDGVDTVYVGFPIWWYDAPRIIDTFMDEPSLRGRKVVVFATSGGTQIDGAYAKLSARHPELNVVKGRLLRGTDAVDWAEELRNG